ncbi:hypothetical protein AAE478_000632 [Parahypoxylon ruwenzoriense]
MVLQLTTNRGISGTRLIRALRQEDRLSRARWNAVSDIGVGIKPVAGKIGKESGCMEVGRLRVFGGRRRKRAKDESEEDEDDDDDDDGILLYKKTVKTMD